MNPPVASTLGARATPYLLVGLPALFLLVFFVIPTLTLFSASVLESDGMVPTSTLTTANFRTLLTHRIYTDAILRSFEIGIAVGALVVLLAYPIAYLLVRTTTRWPQRMPRPVVGHLDWWLS